MSAGQLIMVVDDEAAAREMVGDYLTMHGFRVTLCDSAAALRQALEVERPALVVLDLNMPEEDGLSVVRDLKQRMPLPIIMLTATASPDDRITGLDLGADDYVAKPCELRELLARIRCRAAPGRAHRATPVGVAGQRVTDALPAPRRSTSVPMRQLRDQGGKRAWP